MEAYGGRAGAAVGVITLLTDFGTADGYVGEMKGVIAAAAPGVALLDIAHDIPAHDIDGGRLALARYWRRFPSGSVHVVVVDPGVGSERSALAVASEGRFLVGPDNGVLTPALLCAGVQCVALPVPGSAAPTFHGRDVFAPAAAALARGEGLEALGPPAESPVLRRTPEPQRREDGAVEGQVITIDRFGNAVTNLLASGGEWIDVDGRRVPLVRTYADVPPGAPLALVGSAGLVEVAVREGRAAELLRLGRGDPVILYPP